MRASPFDRLKPILKRALPSPVWQRLRAVAGRVAPRRAPLAAPSDVQPLAAAQQNIYETLYEAHGKLFSDDDVVGAGAFDLIGRIELGVLLMEGLRPTDTVVDFGCGTGRLAVHLIPALRGGHYIGVDVSQSMLDKAQMRLPRAIPAPPCRVTWVKQTSPVFPFPDGSVDLICAFSVFTHIEHEDTYRYLKDALRAVRPGGRFIFSCLPMELPIAREVFLVSTQVDFQARWSHVRNVTTSVDLMEAIARLAGWTPRRWYAGNQHNIRLPETGELMALGQSTCVLEAPGAGPAAVPAGQAAATPEELGRIALTWTDPSVTLHPHFTGPLPGSPDRFHLFPSPGQRTAGALAAAPFAALTVDPDRPAATIAVSRVTSGTYRYAVVARGGGEAGEALSRSGATVQVSHRDAPRATTFTVPEGAGPRWTVFDVVVDGYAVALRPVNTRSAHADDAASEAWSPEAEGTMDPGLDADRRCPLCETDQPFAVTMRKHVFQYRRCRTCGVLYAIPRPTPGGLLRHLADLAREAPAMGPAEQDTAIRSMAYRLDRLRRHRPGARTVLDIGAGNGAFLAAARRAGLDAWGVELVPGTARFPGVEILAGEIQALDLAPRAYDVVTLWDTVEHLADPVGMLRRAFPLVADGGIVVIETPNERGVSARLRGAEWWVFGPADHLVMFSPRTVRELIRRAGGRTAHVETREVCPWNPPGSAEPLPPRGIRFERLRAVPAARALPAGCGLGDWVLAIGRPP